MFQFFGSGEKGGKVRDLELYAPILASVGLKIPESLVLQTALFFDVIDQFSIPEDMDWSGWDQFKEIQPQIIEEFGPKILEWMKPGIPYAIRSSAVSENGGTGIYRSTFFVPNGEQSRDLWHLWDVLREIYVSEYTRDAREWRKKAKLPMGMAVLIQPVHGFRFEDFFLPALSGVAYTSYYGEPLVRAVVGMGVAAVEGKGLIFKSAPRNPQREFWDEPGIAIKIPSGALVEIGSGYQEISIAIDTSPFAKLFEQIAELRKKGEFYLEWAMDGNETKIVQCSPHVEKPIPNLFVEPEKNLLLGKSTDVVGSGKVECKKVVFVSCWVRETVSVLERLNEEMKDYLLILPSEAFSTMANIISFGDDRRSSPVGQIKFSHFSNATALVEKQREYYPAQMLNHKLVYGYCPIDHSDGTGATHFQELCDKTDKLFLGMEIDMNLFQMFQQKEYAKGEVIVYDVPVLAVVDRERKEGSIYLPK